MPPARSSAKPRAARSRCQLSPHGQGAAMSPRPSETARGTSMIEDTDKLLTRPPLPSAARLSGRKFGLVALTAFGLLLVYLFLTLSARQRGRATPQPPPTPGVYEVSGTTEPDVALRLQSSYAGWNREPPPPKTPP